MTYTRKKKRMDTELEAAVELMSAKKVRGGRGAVGLKMTGGGCAHKRLCLHHRRCSKRLIKSALRRRPSAPRNLDVCF